MQPRLGLCVIQGRCFLLPNRAATQALKCNRKGLLAARIFLGLPAAGVAAALTGIDLTTTGKAVASLPFAITQRHTGFYVFISIHHFSPSLKVKNY
jgi:hypothetical protein